MRIQMATDHCEKLHRVLVALFACVALATTVRVSQAAAPTILEPGYHVTPVPGCGFGYNNGVPHPLGPGQIMGAACSPGGVWGDFLALSISTPWDDDGSYVESVDLSGRSNGYLGFSGHVFPVHLAFSPPGWRGGNRLFIDVYNFGGGINLSSIEARNPVGGVESSFGTGAGFSPLAVDPWGDFNSDLLYDLTTWPSGPFQGVFRKDAAGGTSLVSSAATVGHFGSGGPWGTGLYGGGYILYGDGTRTPFPGGFADRNHFDFVNGTGFGGDLFSLCTVSGQPEICRVHPDGTRTPFASTSAMVLGCGGSLWLLSPGDCYKVEAARANASATVSPSTLNVRGNGNDISIHINAADAATGAPVDLSLLSAAHVSRVSSPSIGELTLPTPSAAAGCNDSTQDGIWETLSQRVIQGSGSATLRFSMPSDGRCATLDGNRQDVIALLLDVPDGETASICVSGVHPDTGFVEACGAVTIQNRGNR